MIPASSRKIILENARTVVAQADAASRDSLQRLADVIAQYRGVEGRKIGRALLRGLPPDATSSRELEQVAAAAAQSYAVFYAFDLNRRAGTDVAQQLTPSTSAAPEVLARTEPLGSLAAETDGALINDAASHLDAALTRIADQAQDYYLVGFTPSAAALASRGNYRRVSVRVKRPGARVSARTGYATAKSTVPPDRRLAIDAVLAAPFAQQALARRLHDLHACDRTTPGRARVLLSLEADLPVGDGGAPVGRRRLPRPRRARRPGRRQRHRHDGAAGEGRRGERDGRRHLSCALRGAAGLVPDAHGRPRTRAGCVGSADRKLDVRGLSGPDITVGDVVLGSATGALPVRARAYAQDGLDRHGRDLRPVAGAAAGADGDRRDRARSALETGRGDGSRRASATP